jgi:hypothetical protein
MCLLQEYQWMIPAVESRQLFGIPGALFPGLLYVACVNRDLTLC